MHYFIAFQILCGCFSAFVAGRKGRSRLAWWFVGAMLPLLGVVLSLIVLEAPTAPSSSRGVGGAVSAQSRARRRPKRCSKSYTPDCSGCPFFRRRLFDADRSEDKKGYCEFFNKELRDESKAKGSSVVIEDS